MLTVEFGLLQKNSQHSFVWLEPFLRPGLCKHRAAARRSCQEWPLSWSGHPQGLFLTAASTGIVTRRRGDATASVWPCLRNGATVRG
jgi:hypothetical protein